MGWAFGSVDHVKQSHSGGPPPLTIKMSWPGVVNCQPECSQSGAIWDGLDQRRNQFPQQRLATHPNVVNELEESQIRRQLLLRDPPMRTEPRTQQRPGPLQRVDMHLAEPVTVIIAGELARRVADRLVVVAPVVQTAVDVILIGVNHTPPGAHLLDQGADRHLLDVLQHADHDLTATLQHPEDRRLLLGQRAPATLPLQTSPAPAPSFPFDRLGIALMSGYHIDFVALDRTIDRRFGPPLVDP